MKRKWILTFLLFAGLTSFAQAQPPGGGQWNRTPEERAKMQAERVAKELSLEKSKQAELETIYLETFKAQQKTMTEAREKGERPSRETMEKLNTDRDEKLKKALTEEQFKKLKEAEEKMRQQRGQGGSGGGRPQGNQN